MSTFMRDALSLIADNTPFRTEEAQDQARDLIAQVPDDPEPAPASTVDESADTPAESTGDTGTVSGTVTAPAD